MTNVTETCENCQFLEFEYHANYDENGEIQEGYKPKCGIMLPPGIKEFYNERYIELNDYCDLWTPNIPAPSRKQKEAISVQKKQKRIKRAWKKYLSTDSRLDANEIRRRTKWYSSGPHAKMPPKDAQL